jgi:hypothetical protein
MVDNTFTTPPEKDAAYHNETGFNKDTDSSSGKVDTLEEARAPGANIMVVDKATERAVLRKLDYRIIPTLVWVYLMNMMDRVNIGNARLFSMEEDLNLRGDQFQLAVSLLFVTYCVSSRRPYRTKNITDRVSAL